MRAVALFSIVKTTEMFANINARNNKGRGKIFYEI